MLFLAQTKWSNNPCWSSNVWSDEVKLKSEVKAVGVCEQTELREYRILQYGGFTTEERVACPELKQVLCRILGSAKRKREKKKLKWNIYFVVKRIPTTKNIWWICSKIAINLWLSQLIFAEYIYTYLKKMNTFSQARNENHMVRKVSKKKRNEKQFHDMPCLRIMMDSQLETVLHKPIKMVSMAPDKGFLQ